MLVHAVALTLSTGVIPFVISAYTYLGSVPQALFLFILGFAVVQYGFEFSNQALDYLEDKQEGLPTPAVRLGVLGSLRASLAVPVLGMMLAFAGLYRLLLERWHMDPTRTSWAPLYLTLSLASIAMLAGYYLPMRNTWKMYALCRNSPEEVCVPKLPALCNYAQWQANSVSGVALAAAIFFISTNYFW